MPDLPASRCHANLSAHSRTPSPPCQAQAQLQQELAPYGIATSAVDRFIVTQSRQAVAVADPVALVGSLQALTGLGGYREAIEAQGRELEALAGSMDATAQQVARCVHAMAACLLGRRMHGASCWHHAGLPHGLPASARVALQTLLLPAPRRLQPVCRARVARAAGCSLSARAGDGRPAAARPARAACRRAGTWAAAADAPGPAGEQGSKHVHAAGPVQLLLLCSQASSQHARCNWSVPFSGSGSGARSSSCCRGAAKR